MVREVGLRTNDFYILLNDDRSARFKNWKPFHVHDPSGRDSYFISKILPSLPPLSEERANQIMAKEEIYLNSLLVGDVIRISPNYRCYATRARPHGEVIYIDLGCSFVYAKDGFLSLPHRAPSYESRLFRSQMRQLSQVSIISLRGASINLAELVENIANITIPTLNPDNSIPVNALLNGDELREIQNYISHSLYGFIPLFKAQKLLAENGPHVVRR